MPYYKNLRNNKVYESLENMLDAMSIEEISQEEWKRIKAKGSIIELTMPILEPIITSLSYCITKLGTNNLNNDGNGNTNDYSTTEKLDGKGKLTQARFSTEIWLSIFNKLDRNEIDNCEQVCINWRQIIRSNKKLLPTREIDYIIISSKRIYSIIIASNNIIKTYQFTKYYDRKNINASVNDKSNMLVRTHRRRRTPRSTTKGSTEKPPFQFYLDELTESHVHVPAPAKTRFKLGSPPQLFFQKLNDLLRNHSVVHYLVFRNLTLTNSFITKFMLHIRPINAIGTVKFIAVRRDKILSKALSTLLILLYGGKGNVEDRLPVGESQMITYSF